MSLPVKLSKREMILVGFTLFAALFGLFRYGYWKARTERIESELKLVQLQTEFATESTALTILKAQRGPATATITDPRVNRLIETNRSLAGWIRDLSQQDRKSHLNIRRLTVEGTESLGLFTKILYSVELSAPFVSIGQFLEAIESSDLMVEMKDFELIRDGNDLQRTTAKMKIYNYVVKE